MKAKKLTKKLKFAKTAAKAPKGLPPPPKAAAGGPASSSGAASVTTGGAGATGAVGSQDSPAAPPPPVAIPGGVGWEPKVDHGWQLVRVPGGWLKFNDVLGRLDSHCQRHGRSCKMDRDMKKGVIGLHSLWLSDTTAKTKKDHDLLKAELSSAKYFEQRQKKRELYTNMANLHGGVYNEILLAEKRIKGDNEETVVVKM